MHEFWREGLIEARERKTNSHSGLSSPRRIRRIRNKVQERLSREEQSGVEARLGRLPGGLGNQENFDGALITGTPNYAEDLEESLRALVSSPKLGG